MDHGFLYGDGVFETIRSYHGRPFKLKDHLKRLVHSCRRIGLRFPQSPIKIQTIVEKTLARNKIKDGIIRIACSRGPGEIGLDPSLCPRSTFMIMAFPFNPPPESLYSKGLALKIVKTIRNHPGAIPNDIKSANFLNNILAKMEAKQSGADEGILLNDKGHIAEGTISNVFYIKHGVLVTPSLKSGILEGITRNIVIEIAKEIGVRVIEKLVKPKEFLMADECLITSTGYEIMPATKVNGKKIGNGKPGPLTKLLMNLFKEHVKCSS